MLKKLIRLLQTIRFLKFKQIFYRIYYRLVKIEPVLSEAPRLRIWPKKWSVSSWHHPSMLGEVTFTFLNEKGEVRSPQDWNSSLKTKLWLYHLHYLDDLNAKRSEERSSLHSSLVKNWITYNPPFLNNGWEPYTLSLRMVNLVKYFSRLEVVPKDFSESLALQGLSLEKKLEFHILGNHLFANAKALVFAGSFFDGSLGNVFLEKGLKLLREEMKEQFLDDGAHFELSPMYHATLLWDVCDLIELANTSNIKILLDKKN